MDWKKDQIRNDLPHHPVILQRNTKETAHIRNPTTTTAVAVIFLRIWTTESQCQRISEATKKKKKKKKQEESGRIWSNKIRMQNHMWSTANRHLSSSKYAVCIGRWIRGVITNNDPVLNWWNWCKPMKRGNTNRCLHLRWGAGRPVIIPSLHVQLLKITLHYPLSVEEKNAFIIIGSAYCVIRVDRLDRPVMESLTRPFSNLVDWFGINLFTFG